MHDVVSDDVVSDVVATDAVRCAVAVRPLAWERLPGGAVHGAAD